MVVITVQKQEKPKRKDYSEDKKRNNLRKPSFFFFILVITLLLFSGCLESNLFTSKITYEETPTQISYQITYGYYVNLTGSGEATVEYQDFIPQTLNGTIYALEIMPNTVVSETVLDNKIISWNQTMKDTVHQTFFVTATILQNPIIIKDLTGFSALTIEEIQNQYPTLVSTYCHAYGNETQRIIDPTHPQLMYQAQTLQNEIESTNAFTLAKHIFSWFKNHTTYERHVTFQPQPAITTFETGSGDCDDLTYLYLSICKAAGIPSRYVKGYLISEESAIPHVWAEVFVGPDISENGWMPVECAGTGNAQSEIHNNFGVEDIQHLRLCIDDGTNETFQQLTNPLSVRYEESLTVDITRFESIKNYTILKSKKLTIENDIRSYQ